MIRRRVAGTAGVLAVLAACVLPSTAAAARPDLVVKKVTPLTPSVVQKGRVRVSVVVRNAGKGRAKASVAAVYLSKDRRKGKSDKRLSGKLKVKALGKGRRAARKGRLKLPRKVKPGAYFLIACADSKRRVRERKERNNCKRAKGKLGVTKPAKRVNVHPHLDASKSASGVITPGAGGSVGAFAADGTTYILIVPRGAVTHAQKVTMTPITRVDGLPLSGGLVAGVQVGTDELQLAKAGKLVILRNGLKPGPSQVAFGYHGTAGKDFFLSPFVGRPAGYPSSSIVVPVLHGGGYGVGNGTPADVAKQKAKPPARPEDRLIQAAAKRGAPAKRAAGPAKRAARVHASDLDYDALRARARELYAQKIKPQMTAAETNDALLQQAAGDGFGFMRELTLLGLDDEFQAEFDEIVRSLEKAVNHAYDKAKERCLAGDYNQVTRLIAIERFKQLIGFESKANLFDDVDKCLRFELRVTSHIEVHEAPGGADHVDQVSELKSTVPLRFNLETFRLAGSAPFDYRRFTYNSFVQLGGSCTSTSNATGVLKDGVLEVPSATVTTQDPGAPPAPSDVSMIFDPGHPQEQIHTQSAGCPQDFSSTEFEENWLFEWTTFFHGADSLGDIGGWFLQDFTPGTKPTVGTRTFTKVVGARTIDETWEVVHTPAP